MKVRGSFPLAHRVGFQEDPKGGSKELEKACEKFEALFVYYMLKVMRETVPKSGLLDGGFANSVYTSLFDEKVAEEVAKRGVGIKSVLLRQLEGLYSEHMVAASDKTTKKNEGLER